MAQICQPLEQVEKIKLPGIWQIISSSGIRCDFSEINFLPLVSLNSAASAAPTATAITATSPKPNEENYNVLTPNFTTYNQSNQSQTLVSNQNFFDYQNFPEMKSGIANQTHQTHQAHQALQNRHHEMIRSSSQTSNLIKRKRKETKRTMFSDAQRTVLLEWLRDHRQNPYPTISEKKQLMFETGLNREQINVWFTNNRIRLGMTGSHAATTSGASKGQFRFSPLMSMSTLC